MYTLEFTDPRCDDTREIGGKAASLAAMTAQGLPVSPGFAVTAQAYRDYLAASGAQGRIDAELAKVNEDSSQQEFDAVAEAILAILKPLPLPEKIGNAVREAYQQLCESTGIEDVKVAVRSSATAEDSVDASFAGEFETWVDISGADDVLEYVKKCYLAVFTGRVLSYLAVKKIDPKLIEMAVVVQKTVRARAAGVMFTLSPTSGDRSQIVLEASWGLGLSVVGGEVTPDRYMVSKVGMDVSLRETGHKHIEYKHGDAPQEVPEERRDKLCLADEEVIALAKFGKQLEATNGDPQDIEFAIDEELPDGQNLILLQCRPETVWSQAERKPKFEQEASVMSWITSSFSGSGL